MTREELLLFHAEICDSARSLMERKNKDYGANDDPFRNFRTFGALGILVRMGDKFSRLCSLHENGKAAVQEETFLDTCIDLLNYAVLFLAWMKANKAESR